MKKINKGYISNARRYTLTNYFDVWKDEKGNWTVNNLFTECDDLFITRDATDKEILTYLYEANYLATNDMRKVRIENWGDRMEIYQVKGHMPLFGVVPTVICDTN